MNGSIVWSGLRITFDTEAEATYVYASQDEPEPGQSKRQLTSKEGNIVVDLDEDDQVIGVEFLCLFPAMPYLRSLSVRQLGKDEE